MPPRAQPAQTQQAREAVTRLLKSRPRSVAEVGQRLKQKQLDAQAIDEAIAWALACGLLDDARFARLWVEDRLDRRPVSAGFLRRELQAKGVDEVHIARALSHAAPDERQLVRDLVAQRLPRYRALSREVRQRRLLTFLRGRGFSPEDVFAVLRELGLLGRPPHNG